MKAMNKVWVIGDASVDLVPEKQNSYLKCPGGASANVGVCVARLGGECGFIGCLGAMTPVASCARFFRITAWMSRFYAWIRP